MNNNNLKSLKNRSIKERKEIAKKGAVASAKARQERKLLREEIAKRLDSKDIEEVVTNLIERAKTNSRDFEVLRDTMGQKPQQDLNITSDLEEFDFTFKYSK